MQVIGVQCNDSQFFKVTLHLSLLWRIGYTPCVVQYILVAYFIPSDLYLESPTAALPLPSSLSLLITTTLFSTSLSLLFVVVVIFTILFFRFHI